MKKIFLTLPFVMFMMASCDNDQAADTDTDTNVEANTETTTGERSEKPLFEENGIRIYYFSHSADFPTASLKQTQPGKDNVYKAGEKILFDFDVKNYELGVPTPDAEQKEVAVSHHGQHIHNVLNNEPYTAHYTDTFSKTPAPGRHLSVSFLSRSYHESVKSNDAWQVSQFTVGDTKTEPFDLKGPLLVYSRPKGEYVGAEETARILLDWYLINAQLSENGYKVRATINGTPFTFTEWRPYIIEGLQMGENIIQLELLDENNQVVKAPFTPVTRTITLKEAAQ